ncbi:MAG: hypothetical protein INH41_03490 [Myxococcaceae bacterium]|nr:hypothetical protein [Myxococcaceae bacterium]MCA3011443.1 hypothetical protein [Myxococcaceae bacterium]
MLRTALTLSLSLASWSALAQTWNSNAGGWNTGYGTVYSSFGYASAVQNIFTTTQQNIARLTTRQAMINKWGLAAVEKAEREAASGRALPEAGPQVAAPRVVKNLGAFKPDKRVSAAKLIAEAITESPEEREGVVALVQATKVGFEAQPETKPWRNNVAGALAFFLIANATIANGTPEPSDEVTQAVFAAVNASVDESPELAKLPNKDKQQLYELLLGFTGLAMALSGEAQEHHDEALAEQARALSRQLLQLVLKVDAAAVRFDRLLSQP